MEHPRLDHPYSLFILPFTLPASTTLVRSGTAAARASIRDCATPWASKATTNSASAFPGAASSRDAGHFWSKFLRYSLSNRWGSWGTGSSGRRCHRHIQSRSSVSRLLPGTQNDPRHGQPNILARSLSCSVSRPILQLTHRCASSRAGIRIVLTDCE